MGDILNSAVEYPKLFVSRFLPFTIHKSLCDSQTSHKTAGSWQKLLLDGVMLPQTENEKLIDCKPSNI